MNNIPNNDNRINNANEAQRFTSKPTKKIVHTNDAARPVGASREELLGQGTNKTKGGARRKTPLWKKFLTVVIIIASVCIVFSIMWSLFIKDALLGAIDTHWEPTVSPTSENINSETGLPVLDGDRREKTFNFLVVGLNDDTGNNTDTIMLINYDVANGNINVVQIPRDTYIDWTYSFSKINSVFAAGYNYSDKSDKTGRRSDGMDELCGFIESNMCVKIDFYVLVDLEAFQDVVDAMGGVEVDVPCDMNYEDPEQNLYIHLKAGTQTLSGYDAMCMVRNRHTYADADLGRMNVQKIFISALLAQLKENVTDPSVLSSLVQVGFNDVQTNLTFENCVYFATQVLKTDLANVKMVTMPNESYDGRIIMLKSDMLDVINQCLNVYTEPLAIEELDPNFAFTTTSYSGLHKAYLYDRVDYDIFGADEVEENSIHLNVMR